MPGKGRTAQTDDEQGYDKTYFRGFQSPPTVRSGQTLMFEGQGIGVFRFQSPPRGDAAETAGEMGVLRRYEREDQAGPCLTKL